MESGMERIKKRIRSIPDYPKKGIVFRDITPLLKDGRAFALAIEEMKRQVAGLDYDYIVGIESRGFILGSALALATGSGLVLARKKGKLPFERISKDYELEYGTATLEMHRDALEGGSMALIVDDLLATGGTAKVAAELVEDLGAKVAGFAFLIELSDLRGRERLGKNRIVSLLKY